MVTQTSVLYVTDTRYGQNAWHDPSARHRCYHFADALVAESWKSAVIHIEQISENLLSQFGHIIFHRPKYSRRFIKALEMCRRCDVVVYADYDDLIFDPALAENSPLFLNGNRPLHKVQAYFRDNQRAMQCFDSIIVSTRVLASHISTAQPETTITVLPNSLPRLFQKPKESVAAKQNFTIGYFPGSNSHAHDVAMIRDALAKLFDAEPNCKLIVMGRMERGELPFSKQQVEFLSFVDYNRYLSQLARVDLSIAPLQRNVFNESKSAVKLIESVAVGTPILASTNPDMEDHQNSMSTLISDSSQWLSKLLQCVRAQASFDISSSDHLRNCYSVTARLPLLKQLLSTAV